MGRKSILTDKQWQEIELRLINGEKRRPIAREYGISESAIRLRLSARVEKVNVVTKQLVEVHQNLQKLPFASQITAQNNAAKLLKISNNLADAAESGSLTAARLSAIAEKQSLQINEFGTMEENSIPLKNVMMITQVANEAAKVPLNLLSANKERINNMNLDDQTEKTEIGSDPIEASKAYQDMVKG